MKVILCGFDNQESCKKEKAIKAHDRLYFYINRAKLTLERLKMIYKEVSVSCSDQKEIDRFEKWFGKLPTVKLDVVLNIITNIHRRFEDENIILICDVDNQACDENVFAYVKREEQKLKIYLCKAFFNTKEDDEKFNTALGTILHELTHKVGNTEDYYYGEEDCLKCAREDSSKAIRNADNYEYYIESFRNFPAK